MKARIWIALIAVYIVWGSTYLAIRLAIDSIPPFLMAGTRFLISGLILYAWRRMSGDLVPTKIEWRAAFIAGLFMLLGGNGGLAWAEQRIPSGISSLFIATAPLWMVLIDSFLPHEQRPNWLTWVGVLVGLFGTVLLANPFQAHTSSPALDPLGMIVLVIGALSWSIGSLYSRKAPLPASSLLGTGMEMLGGSVGLFIFGTLIGEWKQLQLNAISPASIGGLVYLIIFGSGIGFVAYTWLLRNAPTSLVSTYAYVNPIVALLLGSLFLSERLDRQDIISALIILLGVVLITTAKSLKIVKPSPVPLNPGED